MAEYTKDEAIDKLKELMSQYGSDRIFRLYTGRDSPLKEPITPDEFERLQDVGDAIGDGEVARITGNRIEETQEGMAEMQAAGMDQDSITRRVSVEGQPGDREYNFDDGVGSRKRYIPPSAFMDAINAVEDELGDANQYVASGDAGTVVFSVGDGFERYEFNRPERDDRYPFDQQSGGVSTDLGSLEPETIDDDDEQDDQPQQRTTQGTLGGDSPLDPGEFPTDPDPAAKRQRERMRREEQQESLEGDAPEFDPAADREARKRRQRRAEETQDRITDDQADLTGDRVDTDDVVPAEMVDDDDQEGLASFINDDNGGGSGN